MTPNPIFGENQCANPIYLKSERLFVNCGKCDYCRKLWLNDWATRLQMQKELSYLTICMTLTYNNENLPKKNGVPTLSKEDVQKFFKRVRKSLSKYYPDVSIQYFISGEYGASFLRPHYHLILFINTSNNKYTKYEFQTICLDKWKKGYIQFMESNSLSIRYLAKYVGKTTGFSEYASQYGIPDPFVLMSRNPAICAKYLEIKDNFERHFTCLDDNKVHLPMMAQYMIPRYIRKKVTEHLSKAYKQKYYYDVEQSKIKTYEQKWMANYRNRHKCDCNGIQYATWSFPTEQLFELRERDKKHKLIARQLEDINYLKLKENEYISKNQNSEIREE